MNWYLKALSQYTDFSGRARRREFWFFFLFNLLFSLAAMAIDNIWGMGIDTNYGFTLPYGRVYIIYNLAMIIPGLAVTARRLHDVGKSAWMYFIVLIPLIGAIWLLVLFFTDGQPGSNKWGDNPKELQS